MLREKEADLVARMSSVPQINQALSLALAGEFQRATAVVDEYVKNQPDSEVVIFARRQMAGAYGAAGHVEEAVSLAHECVEQASREWGSIDVRTLIMRNTELYWTGQAGLQRRAEMLAGTLIPDAQMTLGHHDDLVYAIRNNSARVFERGETPEKAEPLYRELLKDYELSGDPQSETALVTRRNLAEYLAGQERFDESLRVYHHLLLQVTEVWGTRSEEALATRHEAAHTAMLAGQEEAALEQLNGVMEDCEALLGVDHSVTVDVLQSLLAHALQVDDHRNVVKWLSKLIRALRSYDAPEALAELVRMKNHHAEALAAD